MAELLSRSIHAKIKPSIDLESTVQHIRDRAEYCFIEEIELAEYLKIDTIIIELPIYPIIGEVRIDNMCRIMNQYLPYYPVKVMARVPLVMYSKNPVPLEEGKPKTNIAWQAYQKFKRLCNYNTQISLCIDITRDLADDKNVERWCAENIKMVTVSKSLFLTNKKGFPVLSKAHQRVVKKFMTYRVKITLVGDHPKDNLEDYHKYLCYLFKNHAIFKTEEERMDVQYQNYLQQPLQPLMHNLSAGTYEVFENDTMKYYRYEQAIQAALVDYKTLGYFQKRVDFDGPPTPEDELYYKNLIDKSQMLLDNQDNMHNNNTNERPVQVMVFGAGRGPLIIRALNASRNCGVPIQVTAVEKNRYAIIALKQLIAENNIEDQVKLVQGDMREVEIDTKADILVSELLGSFGDNELSPECLFPIQDKFMHEGSISIPCYYRSQVTPISSQVLWNEARLCQEIKDPFSVGYVVFIFNAYYPCEEEIKNVFHFTHPMEKLDKNMYKQLTFISKNSGVLHGFAGFFETQLYDKVWLSIKPDTHTPNMRSWFPMYFPLNRPMNVEAGSLVNISLWRLTKAHKVWYEWAMSVDNKLDSDVHNVNGEHYWIGSLF